MSSQEYSRSGTASAPPNEHGHRFVKEHKENSLFRFVSSFPGGLSAAGLLLLRLTLGATAVFQGFMFVAGDDHITLFAWCSAVIAICSGVSLVLGFLTPLAGSLICANALMLVFLDIPIPALGLFGTLLSTVLIIVVAAAIVMVGPGALSLDARLFGLRRITIPRGTPQSSDPGDSGPPD